MENSVILKAFDKLVQDGIAFYDQDQKIVQHQEGKLAVGTRGKLTINNPSNICLVFLRIDRGTSEEAYF